MRKINLLQKKKKSNNKNPLKDVHWRQIADSLRFFFFIFFRRWPKFNHKARCLFKNLRLDCFLVAGAN